MDVIKRLTFGGSGGTKFDDAYPTQLGLYHGDEIDALVLNGVVHGGNGGSKTDECQTVSDYWCEFEVRAGAGIDYLRFKSAGGQEIGGGGNGGDKHRIVEGVRILSIGGRSGDRLDSISIMLVENYKPSKELNEHAVAIFDFKSSGNKTKIFQSFSTSTMLAYSKQLSQANETISTASASVTGEYFAAFAATTGVTVKETTTKSISEQFTETSEKQLAKYTEDEVGSDEIAVLIGPVKIMRHGDEEPYYWMHPAGAPIWKKIKVTDVSTDAGLTGLYDLTGVAKNFLSRRNTVEKYGFQQVTGPA